MKAGKSDGADRSYWLLSRPDQSTASLTIVTSKNGPQGWVPLLCKRVSVWLERKQAIGSCALCQGPLECRVDHFPLGYSPPANRMMLGAITRSRFDRLPAESSFPDVLTGLDLTEPNLLIRINQPGFFRFEIPRLFTPEFGGADFGKSQCPWTIDVIRLTESPHPEMGDVEFQRRFPVAVIEGISQDFGFEDGVIETDGHLDDSESANLSSTYSRIRIRLRCGNGTSAPMIFNNALVGASLSP